MEARTKITVHDMSLHKYIIRTINDVNKQILKMQHIIVFMQFYDTNNKRNDIKF
jgi:hypothetical protein